MSSWPNLSLHPDNSSSPLTGAKLSPRPPLAHPWLISLRNCTLTIVFHYHLKALSFTQPCQQVPGGGGGCACSFPHSGHVLHCVCTHVCVPSPYFSLTAWPHSGANRGRGMQQIYSLALRRIVVLASFSSLAAALWVAQGNIWRGQWPRGSRPTTHSFSDTWRWRTQIKRTHAHNNASRLSCQFSRRTFLQSHSVTCARWCGRGTPSVTQRRDKRRGRKCVWVYSATARQTLTVLAEQSKWD